MEIIKNYTQWFVPVVYEPTRDWVISTWALVYAWALDNKQITLAVLVFVGLVVLTRSYYAIETWWHDRKIKSIRIERGRWMTTPEEENVERVLMSDLICDALEELAYHGKLRRERVVVWYRRLGNLLNLPDLLEKHELVLKQQLLKKHSHKLGKQSAKIIPLQPVTTSRMASRLAALMESSK